MPAAADTVFVMDAVRPRTLSDLPALVALLGGLQGERYPGSLAGVTTSDMRTWLETYAPLQAWVSVRAGSVVGHVQVSAADAELHEVLGCPPGPVLEVCRLFVSRTARHCGTGGTLLQAATSWVDLQGAEPVLRVSEYLEDAVRLYRAHGWYEVGRIRSKLSGDRLVVFTRT